MGCPYVKIYVKGIEARFLVDTGAEISVISYNLLHMILKLNKKLPMIPVMGMTVNGVIPNHVTTVKKQIMAKLETRNAA